MDFANFWFTVVEGECIDTLFIDLESEMKLRNLSFKLVMAVNFYIPQMSSFAELNAKYIKWMPQQPPVRVCV